LSLNVNQPGAVTMQSSLIVLASAFGITVATGQAAEPPAKSSQGTALPAVVAADLKSVADMCREAGGTPQTGDAVTRVDLNGDGKEDYALYVGNVNCDGAAGVYGDREKGVTVYAGDGKGGAASAFSEPVYGAKVEGSAHGRVGRRFHRRMTAVSTMSTLFEIQVRSRPGPRCRTSPPRHQDTKKCSAWRSWCLGR
jgi:hypothetical protein